MEASLERWLRSWDRMHITGYLRSYPHGARLVSAVGGSQPHVGSVKGVVIGLGQIKRVPN